MTVRIDLGHVLNRLRDLPDESVHMVWTSVPYWGLRSYGTEPQTWPSGWVGEHGLEPTLDLWLEHEVLIFREVRRVLRKDGTLWLNIGDAYASAPNGRQVADIVNDDRTFRDRPIDTTGGGFKPKDRMMMPARLAIALQADGWWLRDEIVWSKRNPMPSSVRDRTTPAHEMIYLLSKSSRYFYDQVAVQEPVSVPGWDDGSRVYGGANKAGANAQHGGRTSGRRAGWKQPDGWASGPGAHGTIHPEGREKGRANAAEVAQTRNKRSVWSLASEPFPGAHFATAPTGIVRPCILAGTSAKGVCPHCAAPWTRETERQSVEWDGSKYGEAYLNGTGGALEGGTAKSTLGSPNGKLTGKVVATGWSPSCACPEHEPVPATVLDPFFGSGTTGLVADELGRDCIGIELNPEYAEMARKRLRENLARVQSDLPDAAPGDGLPLFSLEADGHERR